jgi:hypothetical protein
MEGAEYMEMREGCIALQHEWKGHTSEVWPSVCGKGHMYYAAVMPHQYHFYNVHSLGLGEV